jgi:hypothetical protein
MALISTNIYWILINDVSDWWNKIEMNIKFQAAHNNETPSFNTITKINK